MDSSVGFRGRISLAPRSSSGKSAREARDAPKGLLPRAGVLEQTHRMAKPTELEKALKWERGGEEAPLPRDGREARAERTKKAVADALIELIEDGDLRPTSRAIAEKAKVSERTIFQHFADLETLFSAAARRLGERILRNLEYISDEGPFEERLKNYLDELVFLHESMTPVRRASRLHEPFSPVLEHALRSWREGMRRGIDRVFSLELETHSIDRRVLIIEGLALVATWSSWENMRRHSELGLAQARGVIELNFRALLCQVEPVRECDSNGDR
ncbi:MAG TPA: TetR/AcrR family transcriptional regulator [Myxococcales bacterium]|nr:TetR/AcrR family transcriptional regulator [Myxococcales bacterium]